MSIIKIAHLFALAKKFERTLGVAINRLGWLIIKRDRYTVTRRVKRKAFFNLTTEVNS